MRKRRKYCLLLFCVLLILMGMWWKSPARRQMLRPSVTVTKAEASDILLSVYFKGSVCNESLHEFYFAEPAYVTGVYAEIGNHVKAGDLLLTARAETAAENSFPEFGNDAIAVFQELYGMEKSSSQAVYCRAEGGVIQIRSPIDGVVSDLPVKSDTSHAAGTLCASVSDPENLKIRASVPEIYIQDIQTGMACKITGEAFRDRSYSGTVELVMPYATTVQTLNGKGETVVDVLIGIDDPDEALRAGFNARIEIYTQRHNDAVTVPYEAVDQDAKNREYVFVYENGMVKQRFIETGAELESSVEVTSGLQKGEFVVLKTDRALLDGEAVKAAVD